VVALADDGHDGQSWRGHPEVGALQRGDVVGVRLGHAGHLIASLDSVKKRIC
jgi:hypothetical protein